MSITKQRPTEIAPPSGGADGGGRGGGPRRLDRGVAALAALALLISVLAIAVVMTSTDQTSAQPATAVAAAPAAANGTIVNVNLTAVETDQTIVNAGPGVTPVEYHAWTFDGTAPGPVIRVHLGDTIHFTLRNASTMGMQHSIDFHAAMTPWAGLPAEGQTTLTGNYQPVNPGEAKTFDWVAMYPGVFMYHCGTPPVLEHIANGMYGAIVVEPDNLPAEREFVLVNSEFYPAPKLVDGVAVGDPAAMAAGTPTDVVWNGVADQYKAAPLTVRPNEPFRIWVVNAGPTLTSAFHVIGTMFDTYADGNPANVIRGDQTYNIAPGGAAMFEMNIPDPGLYPFVTHAFAFTGRGAVGLIKVDPNAPPAPDSYPVLGDPFSAGVTPFVAPDAVADIVGPVTSSPTGGGMGSMPMPSMSMSASQGATGGTSCTPNGTKLTLSATSSAFDTGCLAAPAGKAFTIAFTNNDAGVPHNVAIYSDEAATKTLFQGDLLTGPGTTTYQVPALPAGTYVFRCDVHPTTMKGTFIVK
jgi:FtsP/CotA-like multicopper oxidase with cupredoxin domain